ncbi:hypothetical protein HP439_12065 [Sphingobacterium shayense]|uniref:hypothetical protein n=1 Tax=Sphingobacterium shayense TaxID=626343 RepID=UPI001552C6A9|nr:hypothetical protein [Sphingobacterium shayense]NQD71459.1 hypothetical protein [Sphingobacterium shayense]
MIKIQEFRLHPRDEFDGRKMSFFFQLQENEQIVGSSIINVIVTGAILPYWMEQLPLNSTDADFGKLVLKIIESDLKRILRNGYSIENRIDLKYWTHNNPQANYDIMEIGNIRDYEITL